MSLPAVQEALFTYLEANPIGSPPLTFITPNEGGYDQDTPYLNVYVMSANPNTIGLSTVVQEVGVVQIDVMTRRGDATGQAGRIAKAVLDLFPRGLVLTGLGEQVRFDKAAWVSPGRDDGALWKTPVNIPYIQTK